MAQKDAHCPRLTVLVSIISSTIIIHKVFQSPINLILSKNLYDQEVFNRLKYFIISIVEKFKV